MNENIALLGECLVQNSPYSVETEPVTWCMDAIEQCIATTYRFFVSKTRLCDSQGGRPAPAAEAMKYI